jgi:hypothetical protein
MLNQNRIQVLRLKVGLLAGPAVLAGNLLSAPGMAGYLFYRHRNMTILPSEIRPEEALCIRFYSKSAH